MRQALQWKSMLGLILAALSAGCATPITPVERPMENHYGAYAALTNRGLGAHLDRREVIRDQGERTVLAAAPARVDLRHLMPPVYHQGPMRTCTGFAVAKGLGEYLLGRRNQRQELSALFTYRGAIIEQFNQEGLPGVPENESFSGPNDIDIGASIAHAVRAMKTYGLAYEDSNPYPPQTLWSSYRKSSLNPDVRFGPNRMAVLLSEDPKERELWDYFAATKLFGLSFERAQPGGKFTVTPGSGFGRLARFKVREIQSITTLQALRGAVAQGLPVACGIEVYESFYSQAVAQTGIAPLPDVSRETRVGGHAVLCVGYDDERQVLLMRNSWGAEWGDAGYFTLPYAYVSRGLVKDGWTATL
jgi:hypothetical protein